MYYGFQSIMPTMIRALIIIAILIFARSRHNRRGRTSNNPIPPNNPDFYNNFNQGNYNNENCGNYAPPLVQPQAPSFNICPYCGGQIPQKIDFAVFAALF